MAEIVTSENRFLYSAELEKMYAMRYRVAVGQLGWNIPGIQPGYDRDSFDTPETVYVLALAENRDVLGCCRIIETTRPHMLSEVFHHYCDLQPVPRSKTVFEVSRYFVDTSACSSKELRTDVRQELGLGITEFILSVGGSHMTWLTHQALYNHTISVYESEPLGYPRDELDDNAAYIAAISKIDIHTWTRQRQNLVRKRDDLTFKAVALTPAVGMLRRAGVAA